MFYCFSGEKAKELDTHSRNCSIMFDEMDVQNKGNHEICEFYFHYFWKIFFHFQEERVYFSIINLECVSRMFAPGISYCIKDQMFLDKYTKYTYYRVCTIRTSAEVLVLVLGVESETNLMVVL